MADDTMGCFTHLKLYLATATNNFKWVKINNSNDGRWYNGLFYPPEVVSRYRDPQLQIGENQ